MAAKRDAGALEEAWEQYRMATYGSVGEEAALWEVLRYATAEEDVAQVCRIVRDWCRPIREAANTRLDELR